MENEELTDSEETTSGGGLDIKKILGKIFRNFHWVLLFCIIGFVVAKVYLRYQVPIYTSSANILVNSAAGPNTINIMGKAEAPDPTIENEVFILKSYSIIKKVVDSLNLNIELKQDGRIKEQPLDVQVLPFRINVLRAAGVPQVKHSYALGIHQEYYTLNKDGVSRQYTYDRRYILGADTIIIYKLGLLPQKEATYNLFVLTDEAAIKKSVSRLSVVVSKTGKGIIQLTYTDEIPSRAERFVHGLIREYDRTTIFFKNKSIRSTLAFLEDRLAFVGEELLDQENRERDYRSANKLYDISATAQSVLAQLNTLDAQKNTAQYNSMLLDVLESHVKNTEQKDLFPNSIGIPDAVLGALVSNYNDLLLKQRMVLDLGTPNDPNLPVISGQLKEVRRNILKNIDNIRTQFSINKQYLSGLDESYSDKLRGLPGKERELIRIKRELSIKETLYTFLLQKKEETAILLTSSDVAGSRIIDAPRNIGIASPNVQNIYIIFIAIGLLLPIAIIIVRVVVNQRIETKEEVEKATTLPIIGEIMQVDATEINPIFTSAGSKKLITEQFRILRSNINYMGLSKGQKVIIVTSAMSGEGKSFVALNFANLLAQTNKRVVVLEFDLRKPKLSERLKIDNNKGLSEYIVSDMHPSEVVKELKEYPNLFLVNSGPIPPNPAELILSEKVAQLIEYLKENYDHIIIDTAPVGIVSDTLGLANFADITLYIVRLNFTMKPTIGYLNQLKKENKLVNPAIVLYGADKKSTYGYGYGYGYGHGYYEAQGKKSNFIGKLLDRFSKKS